MYQLLVLLLNSIIAIVFGLNVFDLWTESFHHGMLFHIFNFSLKNVGVSAKMFTKLFRYLFFPL